MKKQQIKNIISIITIILFLGTLATTLVLLIFFEPIKGISYEIFIGLTKKSWYEIHLWLYISFALLAIINFFLGRKKLKR